jgi:DHA2 family multidrug resistance protein
LGCLQVVMDRGEDEGWFGSHFIQVMSTIAIGGIVGAIAWLLLAKKPIVDLRVFKDRNFAVGSALIAAMGMILYGSAVLIPQFAQETIGYNATWAGLILAPGGVVVILLIPPVGRLIRVVQMRWVIAAGFTIMALSLVYTNTLVQSIDYRTLAEMRGLQTAGLGFLFVPISVMAYYSLPKSFSGDAAALFTMFRNVSGSIGISLATALVTERTQARQAHLSTSLTTLNQPFNALVAHNEQMLQMMGRPGSTLHHSAIAATFRTLQIQSSVLAYADVFMYCAVLAIAVVPLALLLSPARASGASSAPMH